MATYVTFKDITGHTREELTLLCQRARARTAAPSSDDQRQAAKLLLGAFASFIDAQVPVPTDIRMAVAELVSRGDGVSDAVAQNQGGESKKAA